MSGDAGDRHAIIVFDGCCVLCNAWVHFLLRHDHAARYRFAAMQLPTGRALLAAHGLDPDDPQSFLLLDSGRTWTGTDAIRRVIAGLGGGWRCVHALVVVPSFAREWLYRLLARNRYRWFGRHDACLVPTTEQRGRFLDLD